MHLVTVPRENIGLVPQPADKIARLLPQVASTEKSSQKRKKTTRAVITPTDDLNLKFLYAKENHTSLRSIWNWSGFPSKETKKQRKQSLNNSFSSILLAKGTRVFVFGLTSIMMPIYVLILGYSAFYVGLVLAAIIGGNIFSNILLTWFGKRIGIRRALLAFSTLMFSSGLILFASTYFELILLACFVGNISTTGTEAGPFQSIEAGVLPVFVPKRTGRAFGVYNVVGYVASAVGAFAASIPSYFGDNLDRFRYLYLVYGLVGLVLFFVYWRLKNLDSVYSQYPSTGLKNQGMRESAKEDISKLSVLYGIDAFGGGFVSQSLLSVWFFLVYKVSLGELGDIFFVVNIITAISILFAPLIAERMGNLRTMVFTHLLSDVFLIAIPLAGSVIPALSFLLLRQSVSQMDVPTRQAFMIEIFESGERVTANAATNTSRSVASIFGSPITGALLTAGMVSVPIITGGVSKIAYDIAIFLSYRRRAG
jgi:MFS family permease